MALQGFSLVCPWIISSFSLYQSGLLSSTCEKRFAWDSLPSMVMMFPSTSTLHVLDLYIIVIWRGAWNRALSDFWCKVRFSFCFTSECKVFWKENLAINQKSIGAFFPATPSFEPPTNSKVLIKTGSFFDSRLGQWCLPAISPDLQLCNGTNLILVLRVLIKNNLHLISTIRSGPVFSNPRRLATIKSRNYMLLARLRYLCCCVILTSVFLVVNVSF